MSSANTAQQPPGNDYRIRLEPQPMGAAQQGQIAAAQIESQAGNSPVSAAVPFWVTACVRLNPPRPLDWAMRQHPGVTLDKLILIGFATQATRRGVTTPLPLADIAGFACTTPAAALASIDRLATQNLLRIDTRTPVVSPLGPDEPAGMPAEAAVAVTLNVRDLTEAGRS